MPPKRNHRKNSAASQARRPTSGFKTPNPRSAAKAKRSSPAETFNRAQISQIFKRFDLDGNGTLSLQEMTIVLMTLSPDIWTKATIERLFNSLDVNEDDGVVIEEFIEWIFGEDGGGASSFKGSLELAATPAAESGLTWSVMAAAGEKHAPNLAQELEHLRGADIVAETQAASLYDIERLRVLSVVPEPIRRTLEAVCLLLLARGDGVDDLTPPTWANIQRALTDASFLQRIQNCHQRRRDLRKMPMLRAYVADVYWHSLNPQPLMYDTVVKASQMIFGPTEGKSCIVVLLYRWCLDLLRPELEELHQHDQNPAEHRGLMSSQIDADLQKMLDELS